MKTLSPSTTVGIHAIASQKKKNGEKVYNFSAGDPVLENHPKIIQKAISQIEKGHLPYPPVEGIPKLRSLAAQWLNSTCHTRYEMANTLVTAGGKFAIFASLYVLIENDEVLIPAPYWVSYPDMVKMAGGIPKIIPSEATNQWKLTPQNLREHITKNSKILLFNNACNPTGTLYSKQEIEEILNIAKTHNLIVISDEVYSGLVYEKEFVSCGAFPEHQERVIVVQSCSKNFGMTGWRVGFVIGDKNIIKHIAALQSQTTTGVSLASQWAAIGALENADEVNTYVKRAMQRRREVFCETFNTLFSTSAGSIESALYAFVSLKSLGINQDSVPFCEQIIASDNIALVPGTAFGVDDHIRFAFSETEEHIVEGLLALHHYLIKMC